MSASWDSDLSSIIEKTNNNLKLLRKIGDKPQVRVPDVSVTSHARPRAYVGAQDDATSASSRSSARPRAFVRGDDDTSSMGSRGSARPRAFVRGDDDSSSIGSHSSARPRVFVGDDGTGSVSSHASARPKAFIRADDDSGSVSSRASARPKAFIRPDDDSGSVSSRASARPKAFIRADDDSGSVSSRASARPKAFIRADDDNGSISSRSSARPRAFVRGDDDSGSMSSNQGFGRARVDSGSAMSSRPHVGIAGGGGLTAAMLQQHRATAGAPGAPELGAPRPRLDLEETRSMSGSVSSRLNRRVGATGRVPHASTGPRIRVPDADIPNNVPNHMIDEVTLSLETHFAARNGAVDKKVADLRTDVAGLTTQTAVLSSQIAELRDVVLVSANSKISASTVSVSDPKVIASVQANAAAIARLEEHSADLLGRKVSVDRELSEMNTRVKSMSSVTMKIPTLEDNVEALVANRQKQEQGLFKLADRVQLMHRQMGSLVDMKAVENLLSIRLTREFREMEDRLSQNVIRMAEKMEQKVQSLEKQSSSQRQESLAALKNDLSDDIHRLQSSALRKSDLLPIQNAQTQSKEDLAQLSSALDRQDKKLQDAKVSNATLRDELTDARTELNKALQSQQRSAASLMEEKLEQIASSSKEKANKFDNQLSELAQKQKKLEEATKTLEETMTQVKTETKQRMRGTSTDREEENDKLRQRLARSVAELEALATTKIEMERRFASEEQQFQARLKELRLSLTETEKQKETQRLELMQKLQEESKLMGVAQGKNTLLENLLAREKAENEEKSEVARKSKKEVAEVREQIRNLESEKEKKVRQLTSELQAKQTQVGLLTKTLKRIETASAKMLDLSKREAKTVRRVKATKEHELFIAQLKLKEMERVAQALQNGDEIKKQAALTAASTEERNELEKLLLDSQLEKDELKQELEEMTEEFNAAKESQKQIMEDTITKLSSDYDDKIGELKQQIADKEQAMRQLRDTLVEKGNLDALEDELSSLKDEKNDLLEQIQRAQIEHERVTLNTETNLRLEHATEFAAMKSNFQERISELEGAQAELETTKATIAELEKEIENQEALHQREVSTLTQEIKDARSKIDECTAQILELDETKTRLEGEVSQMEANIEGASAEKEEELAAIQNRMQSEVDKLRDELAEVSATLEEKQTLLNEAKQSDESNRQRLVEMAMAQEEMQSRYVAQIDSLTLKLDQERECSRSREQDLEDSLEKLNADVKMLKSESSKDIENVRSELTDQMMELTTTLKASQHREQQLQSRLKRILEELVQAANASGESEVVEDPETSEDEAITYHLDALYATHRRTAQELERLQAEYELTVKQATADSATAQELDNQVKEHETQIRELESVVEQLREELKEQYHKSAIIAKGSDEFSDEMANLREEKNQLERQLQEEEKDRAKREVSYQRRTEMKEHEVEELRMENQTLTAAVSAVREKIRAVENVKYHDLGELQSKLNDLEERTAALQPDENKVASLEKNFTTTRQEIVTLTSEVQSLYQKLTVCCGIMEWSELRASVFDEEEKLVRVRSESARELAKVQSVEQQVLMNAEFLNALLVAHGSTGGDENLLNDFRWMQKYASIAPEIVEKLRKVESRLRDAVLLDLHDEPSSLYTDSASLGLSEGVGTQAPISQKAAVDGVAMALALEKAREDYFSETSEGAQEDDLDEAEVAKQDMDQPDVEHEGEENSVINDGEGASYENVDEQDSIGDLSQDEIEVCDEIVVAEHVLRDEQENSHEEQGAASIEMSKLDEDEDLSGDVAEDSFKSENDRIDDVDGLVSDVNRKIEMTKIQSKCSPAGFSASDDDDMDEVERLMLELSSKQVKPHIDNECDDSSEFATAFVYEVKQLETRSGEVKEALINDEKLEERTVDDTKMAELNVLQDYAKGSAEEVEQIDLSDSEQDVMSFNEENELDPLDESSIDSAMISALGSKDALANSEEERQLVNSQNLAGQLVAPNAADENSLDGSVVSKKGNEYSQTRLIENSDVAILLTNGNETVDSTQSVQKLLEKSFDGDAGASDEQLPCASSAAYDDEDSALEHSVSDVDTGEIEDQLDVSDALEESVDNAGESRGSLTGGKPVLEESLCSMGFDEISDQLNDANVTDQFERVEEMNVLKESTLCGIVAVSTDESSDVEEVTSSGALVQLDRSAFVAVATSRMTSTGGLEVDLADDGWVSEEPGPSGDNAVLAEQLVKDSKLDKLEHSASIVGSISSDEYELVSYRTLHVDRPYSDILSLENDDVEICGHSESSSSASFHPDPVAESSFDADMMSDEDDEISANVPSPQLVKYSKREEQDSWSADQLRQTEHSQERGLAVEAEYDVSAGVEAKQEDESSEEEETMPMQTEPISVPSMNRFGWNSRRQNFEQDDDTDDVKSLLQQQRNSYVMKQQEQISRATRRDAHDDDEASEQSLDDDDKVGVVSIRTQDEFVEYDESVIRGRDDTFNGDSVEFQAQENSRFGKSSIQSREEDGGTTEAHKDDDYAESSLQSRDEFDDDSLGSHAHEDDEFGESSIQSRNDEFGEDSIDFKSNRDDEFGESSMQSRDDGFVVGSDIAKRNVVHDHARSSNSSAQEVEQNEVSDSEQDDLSSDELDPLDESSFDNLMISALESRETLGNSENIEKHPLVNPNEIEELSDEGAAQNDNENSLDGSVVSEKESKYSQARFGKDSKSSPNRFSDEQMLQAPDAGLDDEDSALENSGFSLDKDALGDQPVANDAQDESLENAGEFRDQLDEESDFEESSSSHACGFEESSPSLPCGTRAGPQCGKNALDESSSSMASGESSDHLDDAKVLEELTSNVNKNTLTNELERGKDTEVLEAATSSSELAHHHYKSDGVNESTLITASGFQQNIRDGDNSFNQSLVNGSEVDHVERGYDFEEAVPYGDNAVLADQLDKESKVDSSVSRLDKKATNGLDEKHELEISAISDQEDDESSEEEETMSVQSQLTSVASLNRFGFASRRLNLQEDEDMDEVEGLLQQQSSSRILKQQENSSSLTTNVALDDDDDDEFGESSIQSQHDEFGEDSIRFKSHKSNQSERVSIKSREKEIATSAAHKDDDFDASSLQSRGDTIGSPAHEDDEFDESSIQSHDEFGENSVKSESVNRYVHPARSSNLSAEEIFQAELSDSEQDILSSSEEEELDPLNESSIDDLIISALESRDTLGNSAEERVSTIFNELEELSDESVTLNTVAESSYQLRQAEYLPERGVGVEADNNVSTSVGATLEMSLQLEEAESSEEEETMPVETLPTSRGSLNRFGWSSRRLNLEEDEDVDVEHLLRQQSSSRILKQQEQISRLTTNVAHDDDEFGEQSQGEDDDEFGESSLRSRDDEFGEDSVRSQSIERNLVSDVDNHVSASVKAMPATSLRMEDGESSEEEGTIPVRTLPTSATSLTRFDSRRLNLEEDESTDELERLLPQESSSCVTKQQPISRLTRTFAHDDDDFGEQSHDSDDDFGVVSIRSQEDFGEASIQSHGDGKRSSFLPTSHEQKDFDEEALHSISHTKENTIGKTSIHSRSFENDEFGESSIGSRLDEEDEFNEEDEFGEVSLPLDDDDTVSTGAPLRSHAKLSFEQLPRPSEAFTHKTTSSKSSPMRSPVFVTATSLTVQEDSGSEAERDYMDESFDLDESMEDEDDERHV